MVQTVITRLPFKQTVALLRQKYPELRREGTFFAILAAEYDAAGNVERDFLQLIRQAVDIGYKYVNTIVYPTLERQQASFSDNVRYVVWLCKDRQHMRFNKDAIREKHIWKDVEWGRRAANYNPKGKDPGNVWIPTEDDGRAHITAHILLSEEQVVERLLAMSACGDDRELHLGRLPCARLPGLTDAPPAPAPAPAAPGGRVWFKSAEAMPELADGSVDVAVTSPPYWNLKNYYKKGQIGQEPYGRYLERLRTVWGQCYAKLAGHGSLWVNVNLRVQQGQAVLIPADIVRQCRELGFFYKGAVIWHKSSGIPTGAQNIVDRHEYLLAFSKSPRLTLDAAQMAACGDYLDPRLNGGALWNINRKAGSVGHKTIHPAIYPNELARRVILAATRPGALVLDPFLGSGTTLIAALQCGRRCVGYEYNEGFCGLMQSRFEAEIPALPVRLER